LLVMSMDHGINTSTRLNVIQRLELRFFGKQTQRDQTHHPIIYEQVSDDQMFSLFHTMHGPQIKLVTTLSYKTSNVLKGPSARNCQHS